MLQDFHAADFCAQVCAQVRFRPARAAIARELAGHIEDRKEALEAAGFPAEAAEAKVILAMGDPEELGKALDRAHPCVWSWLFWVLKPVTIAICTVTSFYFVLLTVIMLFHMIMPIQPYLHGSFMVRSARPNLSLTLDGHHINIEQVYELDDGTVGIQYTDWELLPHYAGGSAVVSLKVPPSGSRFHSAGGGFGRSSSNGVLAFYRSLFEWSNLFDEDFADGDTVTVQISAGGQSVEREIVLEESP